MSSPLLSLTSPVSPSLVSLSAVWSVMQASLLTVVPGELLKHPLWLWFNAVVLIACSGGILMLFNVRVYSALAEKELDPSHVSALLHHLCCAGWLQQLVSRPRASTARLHVRVDILSGQVTSLYHQMTTEALSYLLALAIGAALTASLPAVPSDAATYNYDEQPSSSALLIYAFTCSLVLALITLWLERWVRRMERRNKEKAREVLRTKLEGRERIEIKEVTGRGRVNGGRGEVPTPDKERFSANTHESALYILKRQFQAERRLRGEDEEQDRQKRQRPLSHLHRSSPSSLPSPPASLPSPASHSVDSPLLSPMSAVTLGSPVYGALSSLNVPQSPVSTPLFSPISSPMARDGGGAAPSVSTPPLSNSRAVHRSLLARTFLQEYSIALASTLTQGFALLVAYSWVGVFSFVLYPALRRWSLLLDVADVMIQAVSSLSTVRPLPASAVLRSLSMCEAVVVMCRCGAS